MGFPFFSVKALRSKYILVLQINRSSIRGTIVFTRRVCFGKGTGMRKHVCEGNGVTCKRVSESSIGAYNGLILFLRLIIDEIMSEENRWYSDFD